MIKLIFMIVIIPALFFLMVVIGWRSLESQDRKNRDIEELIKHTTIMTNICAKQVSYEMSIK